MRFLLLLLAFVAFSAAAQKPDSLYMRQHYDQAEHWIKMRDGVTLYTLVYTPKDKRQQYPILLNRTPYNASGYAQWQTGGHPSQYLVQEGYILAFQDVRGRYLSGGQYTTMTPNLPGNNLKDKKRIDESSDTWDSIEWMIKNLKGNNGRVGIYGISYPGFYSAAALPDAHPALKAASPQAPIADFFFDDFHHNGAYLQSYTGAYAVFGYQKKDTTRQDWYDPQLMRLFGKRIKDGYDYHLRQGTLQAFTDSAHRDNFFWKETIEHPDYDTFWQRRSILPHLTGVKTAVLTVGGWFDAEDLHGPLAIYKTLERNNPGIYNGIVMGPWGHGDWASTAVPSIHNHLYFGDSLAYHYRRDVEAPFFKQHLKGEGAGHKPEAWMYNTGSKRWQGFDVWPPADVPQYRFYLGEGGKLSINKPVPEQNRFDYISDPAKPVPYTSEIEGLTFTPRRFMSDDQRQASRRPDVLTWETEVLADTVTIAGELNMRLRVAMTGSDADFVVKLIDVYPQDHPEYKHNPKNITMGGYQQLVRSEVFRGRYRNSFSKPEPFVPGQETEVVVPLQDVLHSFKPGHRIMIQVHSTWFPYIDRNPQRYVPNIYKAKAVDFIQSTITVTGASVMEAGGVQRGKKVF